MAHSHLLCCLEDHPSVQGCVPQKRSCRPCEVPTCLECRLALQANEISPIGLVIDNFEGYLDAWLCEHDITGMETRYPRRAGQV